MLDREVNTFFSLKKLEIKGDETGSLIAIESGKNINFDIKRVYYIFDTKSDVVRGKHAHQKLKQLLICVSGSCKILLDNGIKKNVVELSSPNEGVYINDLIWREMYDFSQDCVLLVLADSFYDEDDYVKDYNDFLRLVKEKDLT
tara:strand:- start:1255 stop:1686 length:432 start_codon:yes stop_codon:yes gene_type:complete